MKMIKSLIIGKRKKEKSLDEGKRIEWQRKPDDKKYEEWLEEIFKVSLGKNKKEILKKLKENDHTKFYPTKDDLEAFPNNSALIKISFTLEKPYISKDEGEFYLLEWQEQKKTEQKIIEKIIENPIVKDKFTGLPMVRPSTWKGHLKFAAERVDGYDDKKKEIIRRLFGSEPDEKENPLKGRLYFFPTFFESKAQRDVITPLKRGTRTPASGPITLEVIKPNSQGKFHLLYVPYPKGDNFEQDETKEDLKFSAEALNLMFYTYGFSAKKTSGFGIIKDLQEKDVEIYPKDKKSIFSILYTEVNKTVNHSAYK